MNKRFTNGKFAPYKTITKEEVKVLLGKMVLTIAVACLAQLIYDAFGEYEPIVIQEYIYKVKEVHADYEVQKKESRQDQVKRISIEEGVDWKIIWAICTVESNCVNKIGDGGSSFGAYQINIPAHPNITKSQANDFEWATRWTARRVKEYSDINLAFKQHNGIGKTTNGWYVDKCKKVYSNL